MVPETKVNILLVDDQPKNLLALEALLEKLGQNLVKAKSGEEALKCLLQQEFAVILLDVQMPGMDGFETAKMIRARPASQHTPIIFITAINRDDAYVFKGYALGAVDYLLKPIVPEILISKVAAFISLFKMTQEVKQQAAQLKAANIELEREITKRKQAEAALSRANEQLEIRVSDRTTQLKQTNQQLLAEIAERQQVEEALRKSEEKYRYLFEANPHPMWIYDLETLSFLSVNDAAISHYGYSRSEFLAMTIKDIRPPEEVPILLKALSELVPGINNFGIWKHQKKDGTLIDVEITNHDFLVEGRPARLVLANDITDRKRTEEALKLTQFSVDSAVDAIAWIKSDGHFVYVNDGNYRNLGYSREEMLSMSVPDVAPNVTASTWPDMWQKIKQNRFICFESVHRRKDGQIFPVEVTINYLEFNGLEYACCSARDISQRHRNQLALRESEERFRTALKNSPMVVFNQDTDLRYTWIYNPALGFTVEGIVGKLDTELFPPEDAQRLTTIKQRVLTTGIGTREETFTTVNGEVRYFDLTVEPLFNQAREFIGITCACMDITDQKKSEEISRALEAEKELRRLQMRFFSMASHEFRTPLGTILGSAQILEFCAQEWSESKRIKNIHRIKNAAKNLTQLIDDILTINRAETGKLEFNPRPIELEKFCHQLVEELQVNTSAKNPITFVSRGQCPKASFDEKLLRSILTNLLSNAIKYSPQEGEVHFTLISEQEVVTFQIKDQGIGISLEDQQHLFEVFHRGNNVESIPGTGLGLSVVKKCLDLQGGTISLKSAVGVGTTVTVTIPLVKD
ncbi:MAG TPA: hypothetical protein DCP31_29655 [Cyanobacteria bacterium UBA8543]|nr:hypothetical protein [Cyanobacteria bacterium UBA8543]